MSNSPNDLG